MIIVTGAFTARPETVGRLIEICVAHSRRSRTEIGCITHRVYADCENPLKLFFYEEWTDEDALHAHFNVPESNAFVTEARALAAEGSGPTVFTGDRQ
jgi:quinol monooxygenase YgiN